MPAAKLTKESKQVILKAIRTGNTRKTAAELAGLNEATLCRWLKRGKSKEPKDSEYRQLAQDLKKAEGIALSIAIRNIRAAGRKTWTAYAWWAERKYPDQWGDNKKELRDLRRIVEEQGKVIVELTSKVTPEGQKQRPETPNPAGANNSNGGDVGS